VADKIAGGTAGPDEVKLLRLLGAQAAGEDKAFTIKVHRPRGQRAFGARGVDRRFAMAQAVKAYKDEHNCSVDEACRGVDGFLGVSTETLRKAWQEMGPLLDMPEQNRNLILFFERLAAKGLAKVTRVKKVK
jgi:hypothetical protein